MLGIDHLAMGKLPGMYPETALENGPAADGDRALSHVSAVTSAEVGRYSRACNCPRATAIGISIELP
jgi:hypothetical protein